MCHSQLICIEHNTLVTVVLFKIFYVYRSVLLDLHLLYYDESQKKHPGLRSPGSAWSSGLWFPWTRSSWPPLRSWAREPEPCVRTWWGPPVRWAGAGWGTSAGTPAGPGGPLLPSTYPPHTERWEGWEGRAGDSGERWWWSQRLLGRCSSNVQETASKVSLW